MKTRSKGFSVLFVLLVIALVIVVLVGYLNTRKADVVDLVEKELEETVVEFPDDEFMEIESSAASL